MFTKQSKPLHPSAFSFSRTPFNKMSLPSRMISGEEVEDVVWNGEVIENYPEDLRGHSCLMLGYGEIKRAVHIVCAPRDEYLAIITAYLPDPAVWSEDFRRRSDR